MSLLHTSVPVKQDGKAWDVRIQIVPENPTVMTEATVMELSPLPSASVTAHGLPTTAGK